MKKMLAILASIGIIASSSSAAVACANPEVKVQYEFEYEGKRYKSKNEIYDYVKSRAINPFTSEEKYYVLNGQVYSEADKNKMYEKTLENYNIEKISTKADINNSLVINGNEIISYLPEGEEDSILEVFKDAYGKAVINRQEAVDSYSESTTKYYIQGEDQDTKLKLFDSYVEAEHYLLETKIPLLDKIVKTGCYSEKSYGFHCVNKSELLENLIRKTTINYDLNGFKWSNKRIPNLDKMPNSSIQKYINKEIYKFEKPKNMYSLNFPQNNINYFGNTVLFSDSSIETIKDKLKNWEVVERKDISPYFANSVKVSKVFNVLTDEIDENKNAPWSIFENIFDNNDKDYEDFKNIFNSVSKVKWELKENNPIFNFKKEERELKAASGISNKTKSLIFIKKLLMLVNNTINFQNQKNILKFEDTTKKLLKSIISKYAPKEIQENIINKIFNLNFKSLKLIDQILQPGNFITQLSHDENEDFNNQASKIIDDFILIAGTMTEIMFPESVPVIEVIKLFQHFFEKESILSKVDFGNNQTVYRLNNDYKYQNHNYNESIDINIVFNKEQFSSQEQGYIFQNVTYENLENAIDELKRFIIMFPELFPNIEVELSLFDNNPIMNKKIGYSDEVDLTNELDLIAKNYFTVYFEGTDKKNFTDGFGNMFNNLKDAKQSILDKINHESFKKAYIPNFKKLNQNISVYPTKPSIYETNKELIENKLVKSKKVLASEYIKNTDFDSLKVNVENKNYFYQVLMNQKIHKFTTYEDAKYFILRNNNYDVINYSKDKRALIYKNRYFSNLDVLKKEVDSKIEIKEIK